MSHDPSPLVSRARASSATEREAAAAARAEAAQWRTLAADQERQLKTVRAETTELRQGLAARPWRSQTLAQPDPADHRAAARPWDSGGGVLEAEPVGQGWRRTAQRASEEREAAEVLEAAAQSVHKRRLTPAEQDQSFAALHRRALLAAECRQKAREDIVARRDDQLKRRQVSAGKQANWGELLERLYAAPRQRSAGSVDAGAAQPSDARQELLDWDMETAVARLTAQLEEEREAHAAELEKLHQLVAAVCREAELPESRVEKLWAGQAEPDAAPPPTQESAAELAERVRREIAERSRRNARRQQFLRVAATTSVNSVAPAGTVAYASGVRRRTESPAALE